MGLSLLVRSKQGFPSPPPALDAQQMARTSSPEQQGLLVQLTGIPVDASVALGSL